MNYNTIRERFMRVFSGKPNFMSPYIDNYGKRGKMIWELSHGEGIRGTPIYGVTVIELPSTIRHDLSSAFTSKEEAMAYIRNDFQHKETANG